MQADRHLYDSDPELSRETLRSVARDFFGRLDEEKIREERIKSKRASNQLCRNCQRVQLKPSRLARHGHFGEWFLGTLKDVLAHPQCPLCRLTIAAIFGKSRENIQDNDLHDGIDLEKEVELYWDRNLGFAVNLAARECWITFVSRDEYNYLSEDDTRDGDSSDEEDEFLYDDDDGEDDDYSYEYDGRDRTEPDTKIPIRRARIQSSRSIDEYTIENWLHDCKHYHGDTCQPLRNNVPELFRLSFLSGMSYAFRLVDVYSFTIVSAYDLKDKEYSRCEYMALSYVWGGVPALRLLRENKDELMAKGALKTYWECIPSTIQDAIYLAKRSHIPYLWVDALCLVQDDEIDMLQGVSMMDAIYGGAKLTVIAAAGRDANTRLFGIRRGTRQVSQQIEEVKPGIRMTVVESLDSLLDRSPYATRAWTLQEQLLSQRTIIFTPDGGMYFRCLRAVWGLDTIANEWPRAVTFEPDGLYLSLDNQGQLSSAVSYNTLVSELTGRNLTVQSDALSVFSALEKCLEIKMTCKFLKGLPTVAFDFYLIFDGQSVTLERRHWFPSWCWAGWKGRTMLYETSALVDPQALVDFIETRTWIVWYQREGEKSPSRVGTPETDTHSSTQRRFPAVDCSRTAPTADISIPHISKSQTLLQFWTLSIHLSISQIEAPDDDHRVRERGTIVDHHGEFCGSVRLDGYFITNDHHHLLDKPVEFILLSETKSPMPGSVMFENHGPFSTGRKWELFWVMLIHWDQDGMVAERRGLGQIYKNTIETSGELGPSWKEIILG